MFCFKKQIQNPLKSSVRTICVPIVKGSLKISQSRQELSESETNKLHLDDRNIFIFFHSNSKLSRLAEKHIEFWEFCTFLAVWRSGKFCILLALSCPKKSSPHQFIFDKLPPFAIILLFTIFPASDLSLPQTTSIQLFYYLPIPCFFWKSLC